ncbi:AAA family ATPase [Heliobacterium gestii]|uniref:AAA family ATPase n=1 Tax=Heliomicrobium gestii TaxID=2699 RepID=A0A845LJ95_HELGE|nr:bifunctional DNA primase/polymerase [Heliomicrobium gestii]MBM7867324.1 hypothetical protein [Heliomicrobium gestii]MZP44639.1 AAA family ATPase [Heliomicrobium gestii]
MNNAGQNICEPTSHLTSSGSTTVNQQLHQEIVDGHLTVAEENRLLASAIRYARRGWKVLPLHWPEFDEQEKVRCSCTNGYECSSPGKHPLVSKWTEVATTDEETIRKWWSTWPKANVGIATGKTSGILVLDVDRESGGLCTIQELKNKHGELPETVRSTTGNLGRHYLFTYQEGQDIRNRVGFLPGLDIRSNGGMIVAPPSTHASGREYEWKIGPEQGLLQVPEWLLSLMETREKKPIEQPQKEVTTNSPSDTQTDNVSIISGGRNTHLTSLAGTMRRRGMSEPAMLQALLEENKLKCKPPLPEKEVRTIAKSVGRYEPETNRKQSLSTVLMSDVEAIDEKWLWNPYIPLGKLTLIEGDPGCGKTWVSLAVAAKVSRGEFEGIDGPGRVLYATAEDGLADTLKKRLDILGADSRFIEAVIGIDGSDEAFDFSKLELLDEYLEDRKPVLFIVDPIQAFLGTGVDMHRANHVRPILSKVAKLAEKHSCAIVCIRHLSKATGSKSQYRGLGSIDFTAAARSVLLAGQDPNDPENRAFVQIKSSIDIKGPAMGYRMDKDGFHWTGESELTDHDLLSNPTAPSSNRGKKASVMDWLKEELMDGPKEAGKIKELALSKGYTESQLRTAADSLGIARYKSSGQGQASPWYWTLSEQMLTASF